MGLTLAHLAVAALPLNVRSISAISTASHGTPLLQTRTTPSLVPEVPLMFLKETLLILIFDGFYAIIRTKNGIKISLLNQFSV